MQVRVDLENDDIQEIDKDTENNNDKNERKGRRNIKKILDEKELKLETRAAEKREKERAKRIEERQKAYAQILEAEAGPSRKFLVLEYDLEIKKPLVKVHPDLSEKMKAHQINGVRFMYDNVIESVSKIEEEGTGCILAHSMGLGKTFQIITFTHTILTHPELSKHIKTILIIVPVNTIKNWIQEYRDWLEDNHLLDFPIFDLNDDKDILNRVETLKDWQRKGGVVICGLNLFTNLLFPRGRKPSKSISDAIHCALSEPGPDLVIVDEGHLLKNSKSNINKAVNLIATLRRIVLTGTPLQNNLDEYYVMVHFVKPNLLGTRKEFANRFSNPINNGQHIDSTPSDVHKMKKRVHILHTLLAGCVQRFDYGVLKPYLPPKHEYVLSVRLSEKQIELYSCYLEKHCGGANNLLKDFANLKLIWNHPGLLYAAQMKRADAELKKADKNMINDDSEESTAESSEDDDVQAIKSGDEIVINSKIGDAGPKRVTRATAPKDDKNQQTINDAPDEEFKDCWFYNILPYSERHKIEFSTKMIILFQILDHCEKIGDKVIVFSQSLDVLDFIASELELRSKSKRDTDSVFSKWVSNIDYLRIDGSTSGTLRKTHIDKFNDPNNPRTRLFLLSTKAGGLGINLVGANRCVIFDASWNPSQDVQAIYRIYRFGQQKPVFIYRLIAQGTMEEKIYERQINKQSLSIRVLDELAVGRHFRSQDVQELYKFEPDMSVERSLPNLPKDKLLADIIKENNLLIVKYHEHDSLLENRPDESLSEEERLAAWREFEAVCILTHN